MKKLLKLIKPIKIIYFLNFCSFGISIPVSWCFEVNHFHFNSLLIPIFLILEFSHFSTFLEGNISGLLQDQ